MGSDGYAMIDESLENPRCVYQLMKAHFSRYTPEMVSQICGTPKDKFLQVCEMIGSTATPDRVMTILYALGWTQHSVGSQNIRTMAMISCCSATWAAQVVASTRCAVMRTCRA